jgi:hypothetical protein
VQRLITSAAIGSTFEHPLGREQQHPPWASLWTSRTPRGKRGRASGVINGAVAGVFTRASPGSAEAARVSALHSSRVGFPPLQAGRKKKTSLRRHEDGLGKSLKVARAQASWSMQAGGGVRARANLPPASSTQNDSACSTTVLSGGKRRPGTSWACRGRRRAEESAATIHYRTASCRSVPAGIDLIILARVENETAIGWFACLGRQKAPSSCGSGASFMAPLRCSGVHVELVRSILLSC